MASVKTIGRMAALVGVVSLSVGASLSAVAGKVMDQIGLPKIGGQELKFDVESLRLPCFGLLDGRASACRRGRPVDGAERDRRDIRAAVLGGDHLLRLRA